MDEARLWKITGALSGIVAGALTRKALVLLWCRTTGEEPPTNPAAPGTGWRQALAWAAASGVALAVSRLVAQRGAAGVWKAATGSYPEGLETVSP